jgi:hypothetical protein
MTPPGPGMRHRYCYIGNLPAGRDNFTIIDTPWLPGGGAMYQDHAHDDPIVVYRTIAILMAAFGLALLFMPFDWLDSGAKTHGFVMALTGSLGETGTRVLLAVPCGILAYVAARHGWSAEDE